MKKQFAIGLAAGFGGVFPNLFRLATGMTQGQPAPEVSYLLGVCLFGFIGAGTAIALGEVEGRKAFFLGLGLPAMFQSATQDLTSAPASASLFPAAYAYELEEDPGRPLELLFQTSPPDGLEAAYRVKGSKLEAFEPVGPVGKDGSYTLHVPASASSVRLRIGESRSDWFDLPRGKLPELEVSIERKAWSGVQQAIGVRGVALYTIKLQEVDHGKR